MNLHAQLHLYEFIYPMNSSNMNMFHPLSIKVISMGMTQVEVTLQTVAFWQRILEGEKYITGLLIPVAIFTIRQSFLQVIASAGSDQVVKRLTRILLNDFDQRYHPTTNGQLQYSRDVAVGFGNRYTHIHPHFFKAVFLDPRTLIT
jgi:hypothetical protein